jgi:hypothetical protein
MADASGPANGGGGFREFIRGVQQLVERARPVILTAQQTMDQWITATAPVVNRWAIEANRALVPVRAWLAEHGPEVAEVMLALKRFSAGAHVENWAELDEDEWLAALDLMRADDGVPIAWLPPGPIVKELVAASDHEERNRVLMAHEKEIAADGRRVLAEVTHANLAGLRSAIASAWDAWDADLTMPAQALAAAAVVAIIDEHLGFEAFSDFRKKWEPHRDVHSAEWELTAFRVAAVMCSLSTAVQREDQGPFPGFNRHTTLHGLDQAQYSRANALRALMLVTSAARELQFAAADEDDHPRVGASSSAAGPRRGRRDQRGQPS